jgi:DNA repair exonuclease SbcCD nuclease subunit
MSRYGQQRHEEETGMVRFLHTADVQLIGTAPGDPPAVQARRAARLSTVQTIADLARAEQVDFLLICGDLFEDNLVSDLLVHQLLRILQEAELPVYLLPGNHDPLTANSVYNHPAFQREPSNVHVLRTREPVAATESCTLYPCPVMNRTSMADPTADIPPRAVPGEVRVGVAHGSLRIESKFQDHDHPISLNAAQLHGLDYLALGHWHDMLLMESSRLAYPGAPEPTSFSEEHSGNVLLVAIAQAEMPPVITPRRVGRLRWLARTETVTEPVAERLERLRADLEALPGRADTLLRLTLTGAVSAESFPHLAEFAAWLAAAGFLQQEVRHQVRCLEELHGALQSLADRDEVIAGAAADLMRLATLDAPGGGPPTALEARPVDELIRVWQSLEEGLRTWSASTDVPARAEVAQEGLKLLATLAKEVEQ